MNKNSRKVNAIRNVRAAVLCQLISTILSFLNRTAFIYTLGKTYLGVHGLFSNILIIMSLAELGIGEAIVYRMYKPMAEGDRESIKSYMAFYKKAYWIIGTFILIVGLSLTPFLGSLISGGEGIQDLPLIYVLYLLSTTLNYFFAHKKLIVITDQKGYIETINRYVFLIVQNVVQVFCLFVFRNFIVFLLVMIFFNLMANINIVRKVNKLYPFLKEKYIPLPTKEKKDIYKQTAALSSHKIGGVVVTGTDNILISKFIGVDYVGLYSNYVTIIAIPQTLFAYVFSPLTSSIGNLLVTSSTEHIQKTFDKLFLIVFWLYGFSSICLFCLINYFIGQVWLNSDYLLSLSIVFFAVLNYYVSGMRNAVSGFKTSAGLFWEDRYRPIFEAIVNLTVSILLLHFFGLIGVIMGTTISLLTTTIWVEGLIVYKKVLHKNPLFFFLKYIFFFAVLIVSGFICYFVVSLIPLNGLLGFLVRLIVCLFLSNFCFFVVFKKTDGFYEMISIIKKRMRFKNA